MSFHPGLGGYEDHGDGGLDDYMFIGKNCDTHDDEDHREILKDNGDPR